ncbi:MAG: replicative DNA helicase [Polyangiaceae bacterium]|nr:replicative DNA helicase [Polyangiaceae bacterium]MCW5791626.1 replicative DNA helicase [Polyangiaceae bacterium]
MSRNWKRRDEVDLARELKPIEGRVPPHDLDAEAAVLSSVLLEPEAFDRVQERLQPEHFYSDANRRIYDAMVQLQLAQRPVDVVTVASYLQDRQRLEQIGGTPYLAQLAYAQPAVAHVEAHAATVREKWRLRQLIATCQRFAAEGYGDVGETQLFIDRAEQAIFDLARSPEASSIVPVSKAINRAFELMSEAAKRGGRTTGIETGFYNLDAKTSGLHPGDLYIVAARPAMGKTSYVLNIATNVASPRMGMDAEGNRVELPGHGVAFFSLEMPREQLAARVLASEGRVNVGALRSGKMDADDWNRLTDAAARLGRLPLWLDDTPGLTLLDLRAKVRRLQAEIARGDHETGADRLGLVVIDYLQLMQGRANAQSREQEISELSRGLKGLAKEVGVPVIALSQLNRSVETRNAKDKRPQLSDLRESGAIEQDADAIFFIYRDEYYFKDSADVGIAEVIIGKQRNGPTGTVRVRFQADYTRFDNLAEGSYEFDEYDDFDGYDPNNAG